MAKQQWKTWATGVSLAAAIAVACSSDKTNSPSDKLNLGGEAGDDGKSTGGSGAKGGAASMGGEVGVAGETTGFGGQNGGAGATTDVGVAGAASLSGGASGIAGASGAANLAGAAGQGVDCQDATKSCYKCSPSSNQQILNHCTDAKCVAFDNKTLTKFVNGQLPALP